MIPVPKTTPHSLQSEICPAIISNIKPDSHQHRKTNKPESSENTYFSPLSEAASQTGLNIIDSSRDLNENTLIFNFRFDDTKVKAIHAQGFWELKSQKMEMDLSFEVNESMIKHGHETERRLKFQFCISVENIHFREVNIREHKEKLPEFLLRIAQTIAEYAASKDKEITSLILDLEDVKEIFSMDNGKMLKNIISVICLIHLTNNILEKDKKGVAIYIPRKKETRLDYFEMNYTNIKISIKVEESFLNKHKDKSPQETLIKKHTDSLNLPASEEKDTELFKSKKISLHSKTSQK